MMEWITPIVDVADRKRLLGKEMNEDDETIQYNRLPLGAWLIERVGVLSRLDPIMKKKL